jgi:Diguanylate cyclase, GGDEF domain/CHASE domain
MVSFRSGRVRRSEFSAFARSLDLTDRYPGLQGVGWRSLVTTGSCRVPGPARADGEPGFAIRPPGRRPAYYVTEYSYPRIPSSSALGTDARAQRPARGPTVGAGPGGRPLPGGRPAGPDRHRHRGGQPAGLGRGAAAGAGQAARSGQPVCVGLLDLDHFKAYNDQHGHQAGDRLLKACAAAWQSRLRKTDLLARYGGEEFAVLLPDCALDDARGGQLGPARGRRPADRPGRPGPVRRQGRRAGPVPRRSRPGP